MNTWNIPPVIKVYEALGALADGRLEMVDHCHARVASSDGSKCYDVAWDPNANAIMTNDNGSYWVGYLGYPAIAFLMDRGVLSYDEDTAQLLKGIAWKEINQKYKNDFEKTMEEIFSSLSTEKRTRIETFGERVLREIALHKVEKLGKRKRPPRKNGV